MTTRRKAIVTLLLLGLLTIFSCWLLDINYGGQPKLWRAPEGKIAWRSSNSYADGKVRVYVGSVRDHGYRIGDTIPIRIVVEADPSVEVDFSALAEAVLSNQANAFEMAEPASIAFSINERGLVWQIDLSVRSFVPDDTLQFTAMFRIATRNRTGDLIWQTVRTPAIKLGTTRTAHKDDQFDLGDRQPRSQSQWPLGSGLIGLGLLCMFIPVLMLVRSLHWPRRASTPKSPEEALWQRLDSVAKQARWSGFGERQLVAIAAALRCYWGVESVPLSTLSGTTSGYSGVVMVHVLRQLDQAIYANQPLAAADVRYLYGKVEEVIPRQPA